MSDKLWLVVTGLRCSTQLNDKLRFIGHKNKCGLLIFPGKLPQAPSGRQSAAPQLTALRLRARVHSVPPRELTPAFLNRERTPPPKPPLTAILSLTRFTLYTLLVRILPWQRPCQLT